MKAFWFLFPVIVGWTCAYISSVWFSPILNWHDTPKIFTLLIIWLCSWVIAFDEAFGKES